MNAKYFNQRKQSFELVAGDAQRSLAERVNALTELFFMHQGDVHQQARYVRLIQDMTRDY